MGALVQQHSTTGGAANSKTETFAPCTAGNVMIICAATNESVLTNDIATPSGWTLLHTYRQGTDTANLAVFGKVSVGGETSQVIASTVGAQRLQTWFGEFSGVSMSVGGTSTNGLAGAGATSGNTGSITPVNPTDLYIGFVAVRQVVTITGSSAYTLATVNNEGGAASTAKLTVMVRYRTAPVDPAQVNYTFSGTAQYAAVGVRLLVTGGTVYTLNLTASFTPTGSLPKGIQNRSLAGSIAPVGSDPVRAVSRRLTGSLGFSGARTASTARRLTGALSFTGSLPSTSSLSHAMTAGFTPSGTLTKLPQKALTAALAPSGRLLAGLGVLRGTFTPSGVLHKATTKGTAFTASLSFTGSFSRSFAFIKSLTGALSFTGSLPMRKTNRTLTAGFTPTGVFTRVINVLQLLLPAGLSFSGDITKQTSRTLAASLQPTGDLSKSTSRTLPAAAISFTGSVGNRIGKVFFGALRSAGSLSSLYVPGPGPTAAVSSFEVSDAPGGGGFGAVMSEGFFKRYTPSYRSTLRKQKP